MHILAVHTFQGITSLQQLFLDLCHQPDTWVPNAWIPNGLQWAVPLGSDGMTNVQINKLNTLRNVQIYNTHPEIYHFSQDACWTYDRIIYKSTSQTDARFRHGNKGHIKSFGAWPKHVDCLMLENGNIANSIS